jgi:hypothetical protein
VTKRPPLANDFPFGTSVAGNQPVVSVVTPQVVSLFLCGAEGRSREMGLFSSKTLDSMETLFIDQLQDLYDAEQRLVKALPKMADEKLNRIAEQKVNVQAAGSR